MLMDITLLDTILVQEFNVTFTFFQSKKFQWQMEFNKKKLRVSNNLKAAVLLVSYH